jgi:glycine/D-amino acid oxidase-like deaminating enzyme
MFTLGHCRPGLVAQRLEELPAGDILKVKLGSSDDRAFLSAVVRHSAKPLFLDGNQGIGSLEELMSLLALVEPGRVVGVETNRGAVSCSYLINAAGAHAYHLASLAGLELPVFPVRHEYFVSVPMPELSPTMPCFRIPEWTLYGRVRDGGLLLGGWEPQAMGLNPRDFTLTDAVPPVDPDWEVLNGFARALAELFPGAGTVQKDWVGRGWPTFTPDGRFLIGETARVPGFVMACGCNAHGISGSGGIGRLLVESLFNSNPSAYLQSLSPNRFLNQTIDWSAAQSASRHVYETYYGV